MSGPSRRKLQFDPTQPWLIDFGRIAYESGVPKNALRWVWKCSCAKCARLDPMEIMHGPFKTLRAAEADTERTIALLAAEPYGDRH
jgi:hypothetical protein